MTLKPKQPETASALVGALASDSGGTTARDLIATERQPGPALGEELRRRNSAGPQPMKRSWLVLVLAFVWLLASGPCF